MIDHYPVLYSFRRCPYAIRARMAIAQCTIRVELREIILKNKPRNMLEISPKGTVPVLQLPFGQVIDESLDIMRWALLKNDSDNWLHESDTAENIQLISNNDGEFKYFLDRYKYADRYPEHSECYYRKHAEKFLNDLEQRLAAHAFLCGNQTSLADIAIFPFIRQFANVDNRWFQNAPYPAVRNWLNQFLNSALFETVMTKYPPWQERQEAVIF